MYIDNSLREFIANVASSEPTPGGGSVSALVGSIGGALTNMVSKLTVGKKVYEGLADEIKSQIVENSREMEKLVEDLSNIVDEDTKAFDKVMDAFKMPKETDEQKQARSIAIQDGYKIALEVPLRCATKCLRILELQEVFANYGNANAITDVGVGILLAYSGLEGALFNVTINLGSIKDEGKRIKEELIKIVYKRLE